MAYVLVVDDDADFQEALREVIEQQGFSVDSARTLAEARRLLGLRAPDLAIVDVRLPDGSGVDLLPAFEDSPATEIVFATGNATVSGVIGAFRQGVTDYLTKPVDVPHLRSILGSLARRRDLMEEIDSLRAELRSLGRLGPLIGASPPMQATYDRITRVAPTNARVLVEGESGTGKELVAGAIHELSRRRKAPFVAINCGAVSPQLIESELFGHERGSFTGAERAHRGYFERAEGGTLFLDEITEMPLPLQARLLRTLETNHILRVGGERELPIDVRVIAATNRDPDEAVRQGQLREDLLYRLRVFPIVLAPLRERAGDVTLLAEHFLGLLNRAESTSKSFSKAALDALRSYTWPGNVRELANAVNAAFILADGDIGRDALPSKVLAQRARGEELVIGERSVEVRVGTSLADAERSLILATLGSCGGKKETVAQVLGISLKTLYNRLNQYKFEATSNGEERQAV